MPSACSNGFSRTMPITPAAQNGMGLVSIQKQDPNAARGYFERAAQLDPDLVEVHMNLGLLYEMAGERAARALELRDLSGEGLSRAVRRYHSPRSAGTRDLEVSVWRRGRRSDPDIDSRVWRFRRRSVRAIAARATSWKAKALGAMRARDYPLAQQRFTEAFDACPEKPSILLELAQAQVSARNFDDAIRTAKLYLASDPKSTAGRLVLANAYLMALRLKEAMAEAESILQRSSLGTGSAEDQGECRVSVE